MDQLLVALDVDTADEAGALADCLRGVVGGRHAWLIGVGPELSV